MKQTVKNIVMTTVLILSTSLQGVTADDGSLSLVGEISELSDLGAGDPLVVFDPPSGSSEEECYDDHDMCMKKARRMSTPKKRLIQRAYCYASLAACLIAAVDRDQL